MSLLRPKETAGTSQREVIKKYEFLGIPGLINGFELNGRTHADPNLITPLQLRSVKYACSSRARGADRKPKARRVLAANGRPGFPGA